MTRRGERPDRGPLYHAREAFHDAMAELVLAIGEREMTRHNQRLAGRNQP